jgi:hypothetical protein
MKKYIYIPFLIVGCYSIKKATKELNKAHDAYPEVVAKKTSEWYPCVPLEIKSDSSQYKAWLRSFDSINGLYFGLMSQLPDTFNIEVHDTIKEKCLDRKAIVKYREVLKKMPSIHDTIYKLDSSRNFIAVKEKEDCEKDRLNIMKQYLKYKDYLMWALFIMFLSLILNVVQYKSRR